MKLLKIENSQGFFLAEPDKHLPIDKITKDSLLKLVDLALEGEVEFDEYDDKQIQHEAHRIIYKSIYEKLHELHERRQEFVDERERQYLVEYEKYRTELPEEELGDQ